MRLPIPQIFYLDNGTVEITTSRLILRAAQLDNAETLYEAFRDPEVMQYCTETHRKIADTTERLERMISSSVNGITDFIMHPLSHPQNAIGKIGVYKPDDNEIGYLLARRYWGKGLMREALEAMLWYLFEERGLGVVTADVITDNERSVNLLGRMGFGVCGRKEKTWKIEGKEYDSLYLRLEKPSWKMN